MQIQRLSLKIHSFSQDVFVIVFGLPAPAHLAAAFLRPSREVHCIPDQWDFLGLTGVKHSKIEGAHDKLNRIEENARKTRSYELVVMSVFLCIALCFLSK